MRNRAIASETSKIVSNGQPIVILVFIFIFGAIFHQIYLNYEYQNFMILGESLATIALTCFVWVESRSRNDIGRFLSAFSTAVSGIWIILATIYGIMNSIVFMLIMIVGIPLTISWAIRNAPRMNGQQRGDSFSDFFEKEGLEGAKLKIVQRTKDKFKAVVNVKPGKNTAEDVQRVRHKLASLLRVPISGVRVHADPDDASRATLTVVKRDMLKEVTQYPHPEGHKSIGKPIQIGVYEDAEPALLPLQTKDLGASHMLIQGMNGSGKSKAAQIIFIELFKRKDVISWVIDTVKGSQTLGPLAAGVDWIIDNEATANNLFSRFKNIIRDRANYLGSKGLEKWEPGCGLSFLHLHIEEGSGLLADNAPFVKMMETARSVGIQITASLQRASHVSIDTAARAQFSSVLCFGVASDMDASFALPDEVLDSGANPVVWRNSKPGYAYLVAPGIDSERWTMPMRVYFIDNKDIKDILDNYEKDPLDNVTKNAIGDLYRKEVKETVVEEPEEDDDDLSEEEKQVGDMMDQIIEHDDRYLKFDVPNPEASAEEARQMILDVFEEFKDEGKYTFSPIDLKDIVLKVGRSRTWIHKTLQKFIDDGIIERDDMEYRILS